MNPFLSPMQHITPHTVENNKYSLIQPVVETRVRSCVFDAISWLVNPTTVPVPRAFPPLEGDTNQLKRFLCAKRINPGTTQGSIIAVRHLS